MKTPDRPYAAAAPSHPAPEEKHLLDYVRVLYKRRWIAMPVFLIVFVDRRGERAQADADLPGRARSC